MAIIWKLRHYIRMFARQYLIAIVALQVVALLNLIPSWLIGHIVDGISHGTLNLRTLLIDVAGIIGSALAMYGLRYVWQSRLYGAAIAITQVLRRDLFHQLSLLPPSFYARRSTGDLMAHATNDLNAVEESTGMGIMTLVDSFIAGFTVIFGMIFVVSGQLTAVALLPFPLLIYCTHRYGSRLHQAFDAAQASFSDLNEEARETVAGVRAVRSHGIRARQEQRFEQSLDNTLTTNLAVAKVDAAFAPTVQVIYGLSFVLSLAYGAWLISQGNITIGLFTTFTLYLGQLMGPFMQFGWQFNVFQRGNTSWSRLEALFAEQPDVKEGQQILPADAEPNLDINIAEFVYQDANQCALQDIQVKVPAAGLVGVTGPTGSGKSTLLHLIMRQFPLAKPSEIYIGGYGTDALTFDSLRQHLAWVPQKPLLFSGSIAENIAFAKPNATREDIIRVAEMAAIKSEIEAMPQGFDSMLREGGTNLSGGQRQRLTLARALLSGANILLLDDPFSALDMKTEAIIRKNLKLHYGHKTMVLVTQRLANLINADHILVLDQGQIVERGTHAELMHQQGWYAKVYHRQTDLSSADTADTAEAQSTSQVEVTHA
ncbi:ABC transporter ATP-binding protein [Photobacterium carnosum]|uniref:Multidrug resistance-like ATP-binding protein MdlA n=1 Tax=Photobacterium carnosum TaxID=2023717 RepID=A0A2N4UXM2_9GAMM|nr:ABC transporter transmembrane domain-containing protein [Photobacterium carnosum]PLC59774.1 multidrug ABC transporter ATP-binding protein [Photobacterium carnosum]